MKGKIKEYDGHIATGIIIGNDKNIYKFSRHDWWGTSPPAEHLDVDFIEQEDLAIGVVSLGGPTSAKH